MIEHDILCLGLTRMQLQTLRCHLPILFSIYRISADALDRQENLQPMVSRAWCVFINPKKLKPGQLQRIVTAHAYAAQHTHAAILLFTDPFTAEQRARVDTSLLHRVDLRAGSGRVLRHTAEILRKAVMPCWDGLARMQNRRFADGWCLLDLETSGPDPLENDVLSLSVSYMEDYELRSTEMRFLRQCRPIPPVTEAVTGITNAVLEQGVTKEQAVEFLNNLPAPVIFETAGYELPFLKALYHGCGQRFDLPYLAIDGLAAIPFGYTVCREPRDIRAAIPRRKQERTPIDHPGLAELYDLTLAVFENLQDRYGVGSAGELPQLYDGEIACGM